MTKQSRTFVSLLAGALASFSFACGSGSSSVTGPAPATSAPPAAPAAAAPAAQPAPAGATVAGTIHAPGVGSAALGGVRALSSTVQVSVVGTSLATTCNGSGQFTLGGVPAGHVQLRFQGTGIDARLDLDGLQDGRTLTISVHVSGSEATMDGDDNGGQQVELSGTVASVGSGQLMVAGKTIMVNASTRILGEGNQTLTLADLKMGDMVSIEGTQQSDGSILAAKIRLDNDDQGTGQHVEVNGQVSSVGSGQLVVAGKTVLVNGSTRIVDEGNRTLMLTDIKAGDSVSVEGTSQSGGSILASMIRLDDEGHGGGSGQQVEFGGRVTSVGSGQLVVAGKTVLVNGSTHIFGDRNTTLRLTDIKVGDSVSVEGTRQSDGSVLASTIKREH